jgi:hypothetical protein
VPLRKWLALPWIDAASDFTSIQPGDKTLIQRETMKDPEKRLDRRRFQRFPPLDHRQFRSRPPSEAPNQRRRELRALGSSKLLR